MGAILQLFGSRGPGFEQLCAVLSIFKLVRLLIECELVRLGAFLVVGLRLFVQLRTILFEWCSSLVERSLLVELGVRFCQQQLQQRGVPVVVWIRILVLSCWTSIVFRYPVLPVPVFVGLVLLLELSRRGIVIGIPVIFFGSVQLLWISVFVGFVLLLELSRRSVVLGLPIFLVGSVQLVRVPIIVVRKHMGLPIVLRSGFVLVRLFLGLLLVL